MKTPCEFITTRILPVIRAEIVKSLINDYGLKQLEIAARLGITQASVSKYMTESRGNGCAVLDAFPEISNYAKKTAKKIASSKNTRVDVPLCGVCRMLQKSPKFVVYYEKIVKHKLCSICELR